VERFGLLKPREVFVGAGKGFEATRRRCYRYGMMTTAAQPMTLRAIVVVPESVSAEKHPSCRLLRELGHRVSVARSVEDVTELLIGGATDLLVADLPDEAERRQLIDSLSTLPEDRRPRQVALFSDGLDEVVRNLRRSVGRPKVHVFLKPLHLHGLLNVLRTIEGRVTRSA
jgi:hypothetical protein